MNFIMVSYGILMLDFIIGIAKATLFTINFNGYDD